MGFLNPAKPQFPYLPNGKNSPGLIRLLPGCEVHNEKRSAWGLAVSEPRQMFWGYD